MVSNITRAGTQRLIKGAGAERVSAGATDMIIEATEDYITDVSTRAIALANHAGRVTVHSDDIKLVLKE